MTNPAIEALKAVLEDRLVKDLFYVYEGNLEKYLTAVHALGQLEAQAEQTPVAEVAKAGRVVSEELFQKLITWFGPPWPTPTDAELISALRIAPVYHKEES